jgi:hypothetical protein
VPIVLPPATDTTIHRASEEISSMTEISTGGDLVTYINVFTVAPEKQQRLIELLQYMAQEVMPK